MKIGFADGILHSQITVIRPQQFMLRAVLNSYDVFITGDKDFQDVEIEKPEIMTPMEFLERL